MNFVIIEVGRRGECSFKEASNIEMTFVGRFFAVDVQCRGSLAFKNWALASMDGSLGSGNATVLKREKGDILLSDDYPVGPNPSVARIGMRQFLQLFDEWQEKVVAKQPRPKTVVIKHENGVFWIETSDE